MRVKTCARARSLIRRTRLSRRAFSGWSYSQSWKSCCCKPCSFWMEARLSVRIVRSSSPGASATAASIPVSSPRMDEGGPSTVNASGGILLSRATYAAPILPSSFTDPSVATTLRDSGLSLPALVAPPGRRGRSYPTGPRLRGRGVQPAACLSAVILPHWASEHMPRVSMSPLPARSAPGPCASYPC